MFLAPSQLVITCSLQAIIADLEEKDGSDIVEKSNQEVVIRKLMRRKSKRETKAIWSEIRNGVLRRTNSVEDISENMNQTQLAAGPGLASQETRSDQAKSEQKMFRRHRHNSEGNYDHVAASSITMPSVSADDDPVAAGDNVYENVTFFQGSAQMHSADKDKNISSLPGHYDNFNADIHKFISHHSSSR